MAGFDLYYLFVENIFGSFIVATLGMLALFVVFGMLSRMSTTLLIGLCAIFLTASLIGFAGLGGAFVVGLIALFYFGSAFIKWIGGLSA